MKRSPDDHDDGPRRSQWMKPSKLIGDGPMMTVLYCTVLRAEDGISPFFLPPRGEGIRYISSLTDVSITIHQSPSSLWDQPSSYPTVESGVCHKPESLYLTNIYYRLPDGFFSSTVEPLRVRILKRANVHVPMRSSRGLCSVQKPRVVP